MQCVKTGTNVRWGSDGSHVYHGDRFKCPKCGREVVVCNTAPQYDDNPVITNDDVLMEPITFRKKTINLRPPDEDTDGDVKMIKSPLQTTKPIDKDIEDMLNTISKFKFNPYTGRF
jgi:predicted RNA-binding Zn-ribbon protein involved in translation (DUF1610 family)